MSSILTRLGSWARIRSRIATSAASTVSGAPVSVACASSRLTAPSRSRPLERIERATKVEHRRRQFEARLDCVRRGDPGLEDIHPQRLVEGADLDAQADAEARADALVERLEVVRRPVGRHDDLTASVEQRIQRVSEFRLDRLALQELRIVEDQEIDRSQPLLEGDRGLRLKGGDEAVHELLGRQIDRRAALSGRGVRHRLQKVGLAEADRGMDEQRAERRGGAAETFGEAFGGRVRQLIGTPDLEGREGQPAIERRADQRVDRGGRRRMGGRPARAGRGPPFAARGERHGPGRRHLADRRSGRLGIRTNRRPDHNQDAGERAEFGGERGRDRALVMRVDPAFEEARRHGEAGLTAGDGLRARSVRTSC